ncbi:hypothetical protein KL913_002094 [Ogataea haglerorum]|nr:hypothetical protein KL913_002094 [Ogataea haglerorum]
MFGKQDQQNSTETDDLKAKLNYGAEKEKQIMNEIRNGNKAKSFSQLFESNIGGEFFILIGDISAPLRTKYLEFKNSKIVILGSCILVLVTWHQAAVLTLCSHGCR